MTRRIQRINTLFRREISELLQRQTKDPRLTDNLISVTEVSVSSDLKYAKVFVSHIRGVQKKQDTLDALVAASGFFRRELANRLELRRVPELDFKWDNSMEHGAHVLNLMDQISTEKEL